MKKNLLYILILAILGGVAYWFYSNDTGSSISKKSLTNFAVEDTASVFKIKIIDLNGTEVVMERGDTKFWILNGKYKVAESPLNLLLQTFVTTGVQSTVPKSETEGVLRHMMNTQTAVKIYGANDRWIKTWYLGGTTRTSQGTYMILETPEDGLSSEPYIVEKRGFRGYLTSRFHTDIDEWRWKGVFIYPDLNFKKISFERPKSPEKSFKIEINDLKNNDIKIYNASGQMVPISPTNLQLYLLQYQKMYIELFDPPLLTDAEEDSVALRLPDFRISIVDNKGEINSIDLQYKGLPGRSLPEQPVVEDIDQDRLFGVYNDELIQVQRGTWDNILIDLEDFPKEDAVSE